MADKTRAGIKPNDFIAHVNILANNLDKILYSNTMFTDDVIGTLKELQDLNLKTILDDLDKGSYLGDRKLDINLSYNMIGVDKDTSEAAASAIWKDNTKTVYYDYLIAYFSDGSNCKVTFLFDSNPTRITTHAELLLQLNQDKVFIDKLKNTLTIAVITPVVGESIRIYDIAGKASNLERIVMHSVAGSSKTDEPVYAWMDTTSSLLVLADKASSLIELSISMPIFNTLYTKLTELLLLQKELPKLIDTYDTQGNPNMDLTVYNNLDELNEIHTNLPYLLTLLEDVRKLLVKCETEVTKATAASELSLEYAENSKVYSEQAKAIADKIQLELDKHASVTEYGTVKMAVDKDIDNNSDITIAGEGLIPDAHQVGERLFIANREATTSTTGKARIATWTEVQLGTTEDVKAFVTPYTLRAYGGGEGGGINIYGTTTAGLKYKKTMVNISTYDLEIWGTVDIQSAVPLRIILVGNIMDEHIVALGDPVIGFGEAPNKRFTRDITTGVLGENFIDVALTNTEAPYGYAAGKCILFIKAVIDAGIFPPKPVIKDFVITSPESHIVRIELKEGI